MWSLKFCNKWTNFLHTAVQLDCH